MLENVHKTLALVNLQKLGYWKKDTKLMLIHNV